MPAGGEPEGRADADREPLRSSDEEPVGWGDERDDPFEDDTARLLADRPPHHDRG